MKPRLFVGSSVESLEIANDFQESLQYDANVTVWTQGIFQLSSNALDDLIDALNKFDFAIFIFKSEDISTIRKNEYNVVRDNVVFELGLFIGRLGKDKVFFVSPKNTDNFHLPSDLAGINYGTYDSERDDDNMLAALGPFCNQIRRELKKFTYSTITDLQNESKEIKKIAIEKKDFWTYYLVAELVKDRMFEINSLFEDVQSGFVYQPTISLNISLYLIFIKNKLNDIKSFVDVIEQLISTELKNAIEIKDDQKKILSIKSTIDKLTNACKNLLTWEIELSSTIPPTEMVNIPRYMKGWSKSVVDKLVCFPNMVYERINHEYLKQNKDANLIIVFDNLPNIEKFNEEFKRVLKKFDK